MSELAFVALVVLLIGYVLLDGYDLGMATVMPFVARTDEEREQARHSIAPFWNGNEVWLIAAGASLFAMFPQIYASAFSGFYLPLIIVLWLLMGRGISFELREMVDSPLWRSFWDVIFAVASALLIVFFGIALGNIIRGVPLQGNAYFIGLFGFLLNPYSVAVAIVAVLALAQHGAAYLLARTDGALAERARGAIVRLFPIVATAYVLLTIGTIFVRPPSTWGPLPAIAISALVALGGLAGVRLRLGGVGDRGALVASSFFLGGLVAAAAATTFPYVLPGFPDPRTGLDIYRNAPSALALGTTLTAIIIALVALAGYRTFVARRLTGGEQYG